MEFSTNKITPNDNVKIPSMNGNNSGYQLDSELREYVQAGVSGVTEQYSNLSTYAYGKRLKHEGVEYRCIVPVETPENFDPDKWVKVDLTELDKRVLENASAINAISDTTLLGDATSTGLISLSESILNFRFCLAVASSGSVIQSTRFFPLGQITISGSSEKLAISEWANASYNYYMSFGFENSGTSLNIQSMSMNGWDSPHLKIYGVGRK